MNRSMFLTLFITLTISTGVSAREITPINLGVHGKLYDIVENDFEEWLMKKVKSKEKDLVQLGRDQIQKMAEKQYKVNFDIPDAQKYSKRSVDPSIILDHDVKDHLGNILYRKGLRINPFEYTAFSRKYLFIDASNPLHFDIYKKLSVSKGSNIQPIAVNGDVRDFNDTLSNLNPAQRIPAGKASKAMIDRFRIERLPSLAYQEGKTLVIEEIPATKGNNK